MTDTTWPVAPCGHTNGTHPSGCWYAATRASGMCESQIWTGPRGGQMCRSRARYRRVSAVIVDADKRVCGNHARAYLPESLVEIGSEGWASE